MAGRLFGTDGIRGVANEVVTPELALALGSAVAASLPAGSAVAVAGDTRPSSPLLDAAVCAGLAAGGAHVLRLDVAPTAAVAHVVAAGAAQAGIMISASHNPAPDNGLKVFGAGGFKLSDAAEDALAAAMATGPSGRPTGHLVGTISPRPELLDEYADSLVAGLEDSLGGLRIVVDCANGAAGQCAPEVYRRAGARVHAVATGEGVINDGVGATHLDHLSKAVLASGADLGLAHDGDADRCLAVAADGSVIDGDAILAVLALARGESAVVTTVMANLGFHHAMRDHGIRVLTTPVGDRYVLEALREQHLHLGGEQSGHVVMLDQATTGDGLLTGLHLLAAVARSGQTLADLASVVVRLPQVLRGVRAPSEVLTRDSVMQAVAAAEDRLGDEGRVLVRASGTEPLVRVMVEAPTAGQAEEICAGLCRVVESAAS